MKRPARLIGVCLTDEPPAGVAPGSERDKHCAFMGRARTEAPLCVPADNIDCPLARYHLAIGPADLGRLGETLAGWNDSRDAETGRRFAQEGPRLEDSPSFLLYFPHPTEGLRADVLVAITSAEEAYRLAKRGAAWNGDRLMASISGVGAACGECTAYTLTTGRATVSLGCGGSRPAIGLEPGELLVAAPRGAGLYDILASEGA
ncbi:MAG: DUF169 domain-containing protein [Candidatus Brocadiia bacterium]